MPWTTSTDRSTGVLITAAIWDDEIVANLNYLERVGETQYTSDVSVTGTGDVDIVSLGAITYEAVPHILEFYSAKITVGASGPLNLKLKDGATEKGWVAQITASVDSVCYFRIPITPTAASHTYKIAGANQVGQTTTINADTIGAGNFWPGYIRITRVPT